MIPIKLKFDESDDYFTREAFKGLRTNIQFCGTDVKVIAFTSNFANEGKTTVCIELSRAMAESGKKVLLIDADMRKSVMATTYSDAVGIVGLSQYLSGMEEKENVVYTEEDNGFDIVFAGQFPPNPVELLGGNKFKKFIEEEKLNYDYIIIDAPPIGMVIDAAVVASVCDSAVLVISVDTVRYRQALESKYLLEKSGCHVLGVVLNQVNYNKKGRRSRKYYIDKYEYKAKPALDKKRN